MAFDRDLNPLIEEFQQVSPERLQQHSPFLVI
jgi:hypothetical protein